MDSRYSPLRHIKDPSIQAYFTLVLFIMWSGYFAILAWTYLGWKDYSIVTSIFIHLLVVVPLMITSQVFKDAERDGHACYQHFKNDRKQFDKADIQYRDGDNT